jgi:hypothetical protein
MITITGLQQLENRIAKKQNRKPCEIRSAVFPETFMPLFAMFDRIDNEIIFNKDLVFSAPELEVIATLIHESRHAYQWDRINHPKKAIESKELLHEWKSNFEAFSPLDSTQSEDRYLSMAIEIDSIAYTHYTVYELTQEKTLIPNLIKDKVLARIDEIVKNEIPLYKPEKL